VGLVSTERFKRFDPHTHAECEVNLLVRGSADILGPSGKIAMTAPGMLFIPSLQAHSLLAASRDVRMWVLVWKAADAPKFPKGEPVLHQLGREEAARLARLAAELGGMSDDVVFNAGMRYLLLQLVRGGGRLMPASGKAAHSALFRAIEILRHDPEPPGAAGLAKRVGISRPHLLRTIRLETGMNFTALRQMILLRRFMQLHAEHPGDGLLANALAAGFGSYNQFARVFTAAHGGTPARYFRKRMGGHSGS
jgi:AraC-like DNA-binding protein